MTSSDDDLDEPVLVRLEKSRKRRKRKQMMLDIQSIPIIKTPKKSMTIKVT